MKPVSSDDLSSWSENQAYGKYILAKPIGEAKTVGDLIRQGCPRCGRELEAAASVGFGSLHCKVHGCIWLFIPTKQERDGYAPTAWKNHFTGEMSKEFRKRWHKKG